ncbi:hypothetical protein BSL78_04368 [Apostichopus japonicus]|uniref:NIPSNAP domain-containing protein n=1 Tax=Stichopus japonicus TaxID=307972 RepID=A0A2G8LEN6_STIJA|nr:hypothetical protein BSL78_04368 [Apostichopus japonicus]
MQPSKSSSPSIGGQFAQPIKLNQSGPKGVGKLTSLQRAALSSTASHGKLFELRTYNIKPSCMGEYVQLTKDKFHLRTAHSKLVGFWLTELGGVNESVHLWEYDSLAHRASVRAALASDDEWKQQYLSKAFQHLDKQNNKLVKCTWGSVDTTPIQEGGVYQLQTLHLHSAGITGKSAIDEVKRLTSIQEEILKQSQTGKLIAVLSTQIGASDTVHQIWNYKQVDDILKCNEALEKHPSIADSETFIKKTVTKMLLLVPGISLLK